MRDNRQCILIVDDHERILTAVSMVLRHAGYDVETAHDGIEGLEKAVDVAPDLIILDIMMPVMDGYEVVRRLKRHRDTARIPIIILSAKGQMTGIDPTDKRLLHRRVEERVEAFDAGAVEFVSKPVRAAELIGAVRGVLGGYQPAELAEGN